MLQHTCFHPDVVDVASQRDRLRADRLPARAVVLVQQLLRLECQELDSPVCVGSVVELECTLDRIDALVVQVADQAVETAGVGERGRRRQVRVAERGGDLRGVEQRRAVRRIAGELLRFPEADQRAAALGVLDGAEQLERVRKELCGVGRREAVERAAPGRDRVASRLHGIASGQPPVQRQLRDTRAGLWFVELLQAERDAVMHGRPPACSQAFVQRLVDQRMDEAEAAHVLARLVEERGLNRRLEPF